MIVVVTLPENTGVSCMCSERDIRWCLDRPLLGGHVGGSYVFFFLALLTCAVQCHPPLYREGSGCRCVRRSFVIEDQCEIRKGGTNRTLPDRSRQSVTVFDRYRRRFVAASLFSQLVVLRHAVGEQCFASFARSCVLRRRRTSTWRWRFGGGGARGVVEDSETSVAREEVGIVKDDGYKSWRVVV